MPRVSKLIKGTLVNYGWEGYEKSMYSPDIAPPECHLFLLKQYTMSFIHIRTVEEMRNRVDDFISSKYELFYTAGIRHLPEGVR